MEEAGIMARDSRLRGPLRSYGCPFALREIGGPVLREIEGRTGGPAQGN